MHEAAQRILDEIEEALESPHHDDIVRQALRTQFLVEHGHVSEDDAHAMIWRAVEASGYLQNHEHKEVERALAWAEGAVNEAVMRGEGTDELADIMDLEDELDAFADELEAGLIERPPKPEPEPTVKSPGLSERLVRIGDLGEPSKLDWWMKPLLPKGHLVVLAGEGGIGKGLLSIKFTADVLRAGGRALWLSMEDDQDTIKSRMIAAGCGRDFDCDDVMYGEYAKADELEPAIRAGRFDVVFLDAGRDYMSKGTGSFNDDDAIRAGLVKLRQIAMHTGATIVFIHHSPKSTTRVDGSVKSGVERVLGGTSFKDVPRFVLLLARNADRETAVGLVKANKTRRDVGYKVSIESYEPGSIGELEQIVDDEDREVYLVVDSERFEGYDEWLAKKPAASPTAQFDVTVLEVLRENGGPFPARQTFFNENEKRLAELGIKKSAFEASWDRLKKAGTLMYNEGKRQWYLTED